MPSAILAPVMLLLLAPMTWADEPVFSGPQPGERLSPFPITGVFDEQAGKKADIVATAGDFPIVLIFVHELTRPSVAVTRLVATYAQQRAKDGMHCAIVFLASDATAMEQQLRRARHALPDKTYIGVSPDGGEGPGSYGLNRNVALTILVGKEGKATANFALIQPSVAADAPRVIQAMVDVMGGGKAPSLAELGARDYAAPGAAKKMEGKIRELVGPLLRKTATAEEVAQSAKSIEAFAKENPAFAKELQARANRIVNSGKLENYGSAAAQDWLRRWAKDEIKP